MEWRVDPCWSVRWEVDTRHPGGSEVQQPNGIRLIAGHSDQHAKGSGPFNLLLFIDSCRGRGRPTTPAAAIKRETRR
jgi:hypothetical protein